ncbi:MAG: SDR family oxidoreductase [Polyangiaceae bacterium]
MTDLPSLAVTGSTGGVGGLVARQLAEAGVAQRLLVRNAGKAPVIEQAVVLACSYADRAASERALEGVDTLLMVSGSEAVDRLDQHRAFIDAAKACGVKHIVYTSFTAAAPNATFTLARDHYFTEEYVKAAGIAHTFLRDNLYLDFMSALVGDDGVIRGPAGDGRFAAVTRADVARTACVVLQDPTAHRNQTYDLTGPEALTMSDAARTLSEARGTPVTFHDESIPEAYESRKRWAAPSWQVDAWVSTYLAIAAHELAVVSPDVERLTGQRPLTLTEFLRTNAAK